MPATRARAAPEVGQALGGPGALALAGAILAACLAAALAGGLIGIGGHVLLIIAVGLGVLCILCAWRPEYGLVALLALVYSVIPSPPIGALGGKVYLSDVATAVFFCFLVWRERATLADHWRTLRWVALPVLFLLALAAVALVRGVFYLDVAVRDALSEARPFLYWLVLPITVLAVRSRADMNRLVRALLVLATLVALAFCIQHVTGIQLLRGRVEQLETLGQQYADVTRTVTPGVHVLLFALFYWVVWYAARSGPLVLAAPLAALPAIALLFTFGRTVWFGALLGLGVVLAVVGFGRMWKLAIAGTAAAGITAGVLAFYDPAVLDAAADRATSVAREVERGSSFGWRRIENHYALRAIEREPLLGLGLGADYKPRLHQKLLPEQTRHMHNGFLYLMVKMGVIAILGPILLLVAVAATFVPAQRAADARTLPILTAAFAAFLYPMMASFTQPEWMSFIGVSSMALFVGMIAAQARISTAERGRDA
jgi:O-antigen ligase